MNTTGTNTNCKNADRSQAGISKIRRAYFIRLAVRILIFIACLLTAILCPERYSILYGWNFFRVLSPFHLLWLLWILDMLWQLIPVKKNIPLGSQKLFQFRFKPIAEAINYKALRKHIIDTTKAAYKVMILWIVLTAVLSVLRYMNILNDIVLFMISTAFYVCDLICVLIWCPFRLIMKNRCCTTCRIFNWDHLMMFTPMLMINGFFSRSLLVMAAGVWLLWELCVMMYPERFWEHSNESLRCANCTDKLCTQYCQKLRKDNNPV